jgi:hypothetical protein
MSDRMMDGSCIIIVAQAVPALSTGKASKANFLENS